MDKIITYLKQLDLSDAEAKLYLRLLQTGSTSVRDLAQTVDIKRTTAYFYIDQLVEKGLIMKLVKGSKKLVAATEPENLKLLVEKKLTSAKNVQKSFSTILTELTKIAPKENNAKNTEIRSYKGILSARKIYEEALHSNELRAYVKLKETEKLFSDNMPIFENAFKNNPRLKIWEIIYDSGSNTQDAERVESISDRYFYKYTPKHLKLNSEDILIYDGKVAIINYKERETSVVLQSSDFYKDFKELFDFMWNVLSEPTNK
jgi:sugar-specific transcriptional regulator TrmB